MWMLQVCARYARKERQLLTTPAGGIISASESYPQIINVDFPAPPRYAGRAAKLQEHGTQQPENRLILTHEINEG
jgi:hypothetical protein